MNKPDVTPSLFSPTTPQPTIIPETPAIYEAPIDQTQAPPSAQNCRQTACRRIERLALLTDDVITLRAD